MTKEREKYQLSTQALSSGLSAIPVMTVNDTVISKVLKSLNTIKLSFLNLDFIVC